MTDQVPAAADRGPVPVSEPDSGRLTQGQMEVAVAWLTERWGLTTPCPFHAARPTRWEINPNLGQIQGYRPGAALGFAGLTFPVLVLVCQVCGFTVPVSAIKAGVIAADEPVVLTDEPLVADREI